MWFLVECRKFFHRLCYFHKTKVIRHKVRAVLIKLEPQNSVKPEEVACPLRVGGGTLLKMQEFKYLGVLFTCEGRMECEIGRQVGAVTAVIWQLYRCVVVRKLT